jgi:tetratricopeptide (TPR) repeat protein
VGQAGRWTVAGLVTLAAFGAATWVSGTFVLTRLLPSAGIRWPVAFGIGAAAAAFAGLWGQSFAAQAAAGGGTDRSVTVGRDNPGIIATGDAAVIVQHQSQQATVLPAEALIPPAQIDAPPGLANLPERPGLFVGRAGDLARLEAAMTARGADVADVVVQAVAGLGGIGKSTLAARYAATHRQDFDVIWWITADSPAGIDSGLAALATALQPALSGLLPLDALRERALAWLASHRRWLVVLDNVTDPAHVKAVLAQAPSGRFVITSRRSAGWHGIATPVRLDVLTAGEAGQLLAGILTHGRDRGPGGLDGAEALCAELGYLPLAIEQAGAYIAETAITPAGYLRLLAGYPASMYSQTAEGGDAQRTIARIWRVTLDHLAGTPAAGQLLRVLAFYAPDDIPRPLLDGLADPQQLTTAIGRLAAYSMLTASDNSLTVHRLVQAVTRTPDPADPHRTPAAIAQAREQATALLDAAAPADWQDPAQWAAWRVVIPHVEALAAATTASSDTIAAAALLNRSASFLENQGAVGRAVPLFQRSLTDYARVLGEDHPDTLTSRNNLAYAYRAAGDLARAIPLYEATLADRIRVLGEDHPDTLASRNNLAGAYRAAGDLARAIPLYEATLADRIRVLGEDHPATLTSRNNLAGAYQAAGDLARAIPLYEATLADCIRVLGEDHPLTKTVRGNLQTATG